MQISVGQVLGMLPGKSRMARVRVRGASTRVALEFIPQAKVGDYILHAGGVGLSIVERRDEEEASDVPGHSR